MGRPVTAGSSVSRKARFTGCRIVEQPHDLVSEPEPVRGGRDAFLAIGVEQSLSCPVGHEGQLPGKVVGVHHPGIQALAARRGVDVRRVPGQQHASPAVRRGRPQLAAEPG